MFFALYTRFFGALRERARARARIGIPLSGWTHADARRELTRSLERLIKT